MRGSLSVATAALAAGLGYLFLVPEPRAEGLSPLVDDALNLSGVENPVTAVLLNFRAYDTLLEVAVLVLAGVAIWSLDPRAAKHPPAVLAAGDDRDPVVRALVRFVTPIILLTGIYLAWAGARLPGGAFQAGALLGGGGVLLVLSGVLRIGIPPGLLLRCAILLGLAVFGAVGAAAMGTGRAFLEYPPDAAYGLILAIEAALTASIAFVLIALFAEVPGLGVPDGSDQRDKRS